MSIDKNVNDKKFLEVSAIENGIVIDHIPPSSLFKVIKLLRLDNIPNQITFGTNLKSKRIGRKAIIKITDKYFEDREVSYISLVAPQARLSVIRNFEVAEKRQIEVPTYIEGFVKCANPMCITNHEIIKTRFYVTTRDGELNLRCKYCEKITSQEQIEINR